MNLSYRDIFLVLFGAGFTAFVNSISDDNQDASRVIPVTQMAAVEAVVISEAPQVTTETISPLVEKTADDKGKASYLQALDNEAKLETAERWYRVAHYFSQREGATKVNYDLSQPALAASYLNQLVTDSPLSYADKLAIAEAVHRLQDAPSQPGVAAYLYEQLDNIDDPAQQVTTLHLLHGATEEYMLDEVVSLLDSEESDVRLAALEVLVDAPYSNQLEQRLHRLYKNDQSDEVSERAFVALTKFRERP